MRTLLALLFCSACASSHHPPPTTTAHDKRAEVLFRQIAWFHDTVPLLRFNVPTIYGVWRIEVERCSGKEKQGWPSFYQAPISPLSSDGRVAFYAPDSKSIVFALGQVGESWIVRHELLHWLLDPHPLDDPHPAEFFGDDDGPGKCGHLVRPPQS